MTENVFQLAVREQLKLRICLYGLSGSGKTIGALRLAYGLTGDWSKVALIDADNRSSLGYVGDGVGQFLFAPLDEPFTPKRYLELLKQAAAAGAECVIIDTLSQEWAGTGGIVEQHDKLQGNSYTNWGKVNPPHNELINYITHKCPAHVIINFRAKMKHAMVEDDSSGFKKTRIEKLSDGPIMRPGTEYEFHLTLETQRGTFLAEPITKRGTMLKDMSPVELTVDLGKQLAAWANSGEARKAEPAVVIPAPIIAAQSVTASVTNQYPVTSSVTAVPEGVSVTPTVELDPMKAKQSFQVELVTKKYYRYPAAVWAKMKELGLEFDPGDVDRLMELMIHASDKSKAATESA